MSSKPIAHTRNASGKRQDLEEHLRNVAAMAANYSTPFGGTTLARYAGLLHDIGKYDPAFQQYLYTAEQNPARRVKGPDHKGAGAVLAETFERKGFLALTLFGHHGGLPAAAAVQTHLLELRTKKPVQDAIAAAKKAFPELGATSGSLLPAFLRSGLDLEFFTRMLFSALVDADFLDTEQHFNGGKRPERGNYPHVADLWNTFETAYQQKFAEVESSQINGIRAEVYHYCVHATSMPPGFFRLTVPTGGGKTLSSLAFALKHAQAHGLERVIYAIPYTSIIDQTASEFSKLFGNNQTFIEHHSALSVKESENQAPEDIGRRLAAENWDASLIVTTTVQLFESLLGHSTSKCRKLHNIARSVIVLDEAQMLPVYYLTPILDVLRQLVAHYGVTVVFCTATQPDFEARQGFDGVPDIREIVPSPQHYFEQLKRVEYHLPAAGETWTWEAVAERVQAEQRILVIVNTRRDALALMDILAPDDSSVEEDDPALFHLSTRLCSAHRKAVLEEVRRRLEQDEPCRLIATQVIEAGVDVDFPLVMRAIGPLDSLVQAAGRANREGKLPHLGTLIVFVPENGHSPKGSYILATDIAQRLLKDGQADLHDPTLYQTYFRDYYAYPHRDHYHIQELRKSLDYPAVAHAFHLIQDEGIPVIVRYPPASEQIENLINKIRNASQIHREDFRALQPYTVNLLKHEWEKARDAGLVLEVIPGVWEWNRAALYNSGTDGKHGRGIVLDSALSADRYIW